MYVIAYADQDEYGYARKSGIIGVADTLDIAKDIVRSNSGSLDKWFSPEDDPNTHEVWGSSPDDFDAIRLYIVKGF